MKGKKFNAAEKHFQEKEILLRRELNKYKEWFIETNNVNNQLIKENEQLKRNADIITKYNKLLEYSKLSEDDIMRALKKDKALEQISGLINTTNSFERYF